MSAPTDTAPLTLDKLLLVDDGGAIHAVAYKEFAALYYSLYRPGKPPSALCGARIDDIPSGDFRHFSPAGPRSAGPSCEACIRALELIDAAPPAPDKRLYRYEKNGKPYISDAPLFYFEWSYGPMRAIFGMHGTQAEWDAKGVIAKYESNNPAAWVDERHLISKKPMQEIDWKA